MNRHQTHAFVIASVVFGLLAAAPARAASVTKVERSTWGATGVPNYVTMYIYVPDQLATKPPIVAAHHSCGTAVSGYINSIKGIQAAADKNGFILILPEATGQNCWDVGTTKSLTHDGGGDTQAIVQMVKYALTKYDGDPARVYAMGGSSGAMMTQALMAVYPDVFKAGSARAGVAAACWADGFATSNQWSNNCAGGNTTKSAQQWGDLARGMYAGYTGHRPRIQLFHGTSDTTINYKNLAESIKQWTNVFGLSATPTSTDSLAGKANPNTYERQFWKNACGFTIFETWAGKNGTHSMNYEEDAILAFFGLDKAGGTDPEPACPADGSGGTGGASGSGGSGGVGGVSGGQSTGGAAPAAGSGGIAGSGGSGNPGAGGSATGGGANVTGGTPSGGGSPGTGGNASTTGGGGPTATGGSSPTGGSSGNGSGSGGRASAGTTGIPSSGSSAVAPPESESSGCGFVVGKARSTHAYGTAVALGLALLGFRRRKRGARRSRD